MADRVEIGGHTRIYSLIDPRDRAVRYVGKTVRPLRARLADHKYRAKSGYLPVSLWARKVLHIDCGPIIRLLETVPAGSDWASRERYWIDKYRSEGARLLNLTGGGEGLSGHRFTDEHRSRIAAALRRGAEFVCRCGQTFWRKPSAIARGEVKFCSRACANKHNKGGFA
jgi:hypothetical protein